MVVFLLHAVQISYGLVSILKMIEMILVAAAVVAVFYYGYVTLNRAYTIPMATIERWNDIEEY